MDNGIDFESMPREKWHVHKFERIQALMERSKKECVSLTEMKKKEVLLFIMEDVFEIKAVTKEFWKEFQRQYLKRKKSE